MRPFPFPDWQPLYHEAVFELNPEKLILRVEAARQAIQARLATLDSHPANASENHALRDALDVLDIVLEIEGKRSSNLRKSSSQNPRLAA